MDANSWKKAIKGIHLKLTRPNTQKTCIIYTNLLTVNEI